jgi:putative ABC transport system substrate-binding protein
MIAALAHHATALAQSTSKLARIGILAERPSPDPMVAVFVEGLRELGYVEGRNIVVETRYGQGAVTRYPALVAELIGAKVDVLVVGGAVAAQSALAASRTIPVVFMSVGDAVAAGLVASLCRPGGQATGLSNLVADLSGKQLELLKLAAPGISRVAVLHNPLNSGPGLAVAQAAARTLGLELHPLEVRQASDLSAALAGATARRAQAILALSDPAIGNALPQLSRWALANRLPAIYSRSEFADEGGLLAFGASFSTTDRRAAAFVDKILKGEKPADIPVEQPTSFEFVVNLKTAKALGLAMPSSLVQRANRVIE